MSTHCECELWKAWQARRADVADAALLARLNQQLIRDEGHRNAMSLAELESRMRGWLQGDYAAWIFTLDDDTVGYVLAREEAEFVYVRQFLILPPFRRRGIGRAAFQWLLDHAWKHTSRLRLDVLIGNSEAIAFWRSLGFSDYCLTMQWEPRTGSQLE